MQIPSTRAIAALALLFNLGLVACNRGDRPVALPTPLPPPSPVEPAVEPAVEPEVDLGGAIEPEFSEAQRADYNGIDLENFSEAQRSGSDPIAMAQAMLGAQEAVEGDYRESSEAEVGTERAVVVFLRENLADDSVQAIRTRMEFFRMDGPWQVEWAGEQYRCREGRGQQDWSKDLCS